MRLTRYDDENRYYRPCDYESDKQSTILKLCNKLGQLEDIEEELGIDLITLFNVLKNGIWIKQPDYIAIPIYKIESNYLKLCIDSYGMVSFKKLYYEDLDGTLEETGEEYKMSEYGKQDYGVSWALTKEELL